MAPSSARPRANLRARERPQRLGARLVRRARPAGGVPVRQARQADARRLVGDVLPSWSDVVALPLRQFAPAELALTLPGGPTSSRRTPPPNLQRSRRGNGRAWKSRRGAGATRARAQWLGSEPRRRAPKRGRHVKSSRRALAQDAPPQSRSRFPRELVNSAIKELTAVADAIAAAPGKALHAISGLRRRRAENWRCPSGSSRPPLLFSPPAACALHRKEANAPPRET